jgi:photosystem II stability/assembly factor-like uncharacterized protein
MKKIIILFLILTLQCIGIKSKEYINPDGGEWVTIDSALAYYEPGSNATSFYQGLSCYDSLNCVGLYGDFMNGYSYSRIRKTTDGGNTWFDIHGDARPPDYPFRRFILYPEKDLIVVGCDSGYVLRSTDGGQNWDYSKKINTLEPKYFMLNSVYMKGKTIIMSYSGIGNDFITKDGGENWSKMQFNTTPIVTNPATFSVIDSNMLIMSSWINTVNDTSMYYFKSTDNGITWTQINKVLKKDNFYSFFQFLNKNVGYSCHIELIVKGDMLEGTRDTNSTSLYKTTDGGLTWNKFYEIIKQGDGFSKLVVADELNLIATNMQAGYVKTTDGGLTWEMSDYFTYEGEYQGGYHFSNPVFLTPKNPLITSGPRILKYIGKINSVNDKSINLLKLSPNPATDFITITELNNGLQPIVQKVQIFDVLGIEVMSESIHPTTSSHRMNVEKLAAGVYFVKIGDRVEKFIKI